MKRQVQTAVPFVACLALCIGFPVSARATFRTSVLSAPETAALSRAIGADQERYFASLSGGAFQVKHGAVSATLVSRGATITVGGETLAMSVAGFGRNELSPVLPAAPESWANRVEFRRGKLVEWYANGPDGLEQGFTVGVPPAGRGRLRISLELSGEGSGRVDFGGRGLTWTGRGGRALLRYAGLSAFDAKGRELPATMRLEGGRLTIAVEDAGGAYPVTIDPYIQKADLTASDGAANDGFGFVAVSADTIVVGAANANVGANTSQGAAYVFVKPSTGWATTSDFAAKLTASDGEESDNFGSSVAVLGDTVVVGAPFASDGATCCPGAAYVFVKPSLGWATTSAFDSKLTASGGADGDGFGAAVAVSDGTVVVGAGGATIGSESSQGAVYVYLKPLTGWATTSSFAARLTASGGSGDDYFGNSVAISGDTIVVGAGGNLLASTRRGAAYLFVQPPAGWVTTSAFQAKLTASDGAVNDRLGLSVAIAGDTVIAGAPLAKVGSNLFQGAAYVFVKPAGGWASTASFAARLSASDGKATDLFGYSVAISGDAVVVGNFPAQYSNPGAGAAYRFRRPSAGWATTSAFDQKLTASGGAATGYFGSSVAASDGTIVVGDGGTNDFQGTASVFVDPLFGCPATALCLQGGRFQVTVDWVNQHPPGGAGAGVPVADTDQTGFFYFFSPEAIELLVKIIDGRAVNQRFWVFYGALSDVEYTVTIKDTQTSAVKTYHNTPGNICGGVDTSAFSDTVGSDVAALMPAMPPISIDPANLFAPPASHRAASPELVSSSCTPSAANLCLQSGRFQVSVAWNDQHSPGHSGVGTAVASTDQTGYFWFFAADSLELAIKMIDGSAFNGKFWVFYGALSDVEYTITVTDTQTGMVKTYHNDPGNICGGVDTSAF